MNKSILIIVLIFMCQLALANEEIKKVLGMEFGQVLEPQEIIDDASDYDPFNTFKKEFITLFKYKPKKSNKFFTDYYVSITPKTHQIFLIHAADYSGSRTCKDNFEILSKVLIDKYGNSNNYHIIKNDAGKSNMVIETSQNKINLQCGKVFYINKKYYKQKIKEIKELIKEKEEKRVRKINSERSKIDTSDL